MSDILGMDVTAARDMGRTFGSSADQIAQTAQQLSGQLEAVTWTGTDGNQFREQWSSVHVPSLNRLCEELRQASTSINGQADQQEQTSQS